MISLELTRIIARISGDGHLSNRQVMYFNTCPRLIKEFKSDIKMIFGNVSMSEGIMSSKTPYVSVSSKEIVRKLCEYLPSYNSSKIFVPSEILLADTKIVREYIRTFYDDEGCASVRLNQKTKEWKRSCTLTSNSLIILSQIKELLESFGIKSNEIIRTKPTSEYDKTYVLSVTGEVNLRNFATIIGFKHTHVNWQC